MADNHGQYQPIDDQSIAPISSKASNAWWRRINNPNRPWELIDNASPVAISGWLHLDLCINEEKPQRGGGWTITEGSTGTSLATEDSYDDAIEAARQRLNKEGPEKIAARIRKARAEYGWSPRYTTMVEQPKEGANNG